MTQTEWLVDWWAFVKANPSNAYGALKLAASVRGRDERLPKQQLKGLRHCFDHDRLKRNRYPSTGKCFLNPADYHMREQDYLVTHHIIALKNWGCNRRINTVTLCSRCHGYIHPWLRRD